MVKKTATAEELFFLLTNANKLSPIKGNKFAYGVMRNIDRIASEFKVVQGLLTQAAEKEKKTVQEFEKSESAKDFFQMESGFDPYIIREVPEGVELDATQIRVLEFFMEPETFEATFNSDAIQPSEPPKK